MGDMWEALLSFCGSGKVDRLQYDHGRSLVGTGGEKEILVLVTNFQS